jgi:hypothetical protein
VPTGSVPEGLAGRRPPVVEPPLPRQFGAYEVVRRAGRGGKSARLSCSQRPDPHANPPDGPVPSRAHR